MSRSDKQDKLGRINFRKAEKIGKNTRTAAACLAWISADFPVDILDALLAGAGERAGAPWCQHPGEVMIGEVRESYLDFFQAVFCFTKETVLIAFLVET